MHSHDRTLLASLGFNDPDKKLPRHDLACQYLADKDRSEKLAGLLIGPRIKEGELRIPKEQHPILGDLYFVANQTGRISLLEPSFEVVVNRGSDRFKSTVGFLDLVIPVAVSVEHRGLIQVARKEDGPCVDESGREFGPDDADERIRQIRKCYIHNRPGGFVRLAVSDEEAASIMARVGLTSLPARIYSLEQHPDYPRRKPKFSIDHQEKTARYETIEQIAVEVKIAAVPVGDIIRQIRLYREHFGSTLTSWVAALAFSITPADREMLRSSKIHAIRLGPDFEAWAAEQERIKKNAKFSDDDVLF